MNRPSNINFLRSASREETLSEFRDLESVVVERLPGWCKGENSLIRCTAVNGVRRLNVTSAATEATLKDLLHDPDADVRIDSAYALGELKITSSADDLLDVITHDPVGEARIEATKALGKLGVARVVDPLIDCIRNDGYPELEVYSDEEELNPCWEVQNQAIIALGDIGELSVVEPLIQFISDSNYDDIQDLGFRTLVRIDSEQAHQHLHQQLKKGDKKAKRRVVRALADSRNNGFSRGTLSRELIVDLNRSLEDEDPDIRLNSARALARFSTSPASLALCRLLLDSDKSVRQKAGELLVQTTDQETVELLHDFLKISDPDLQQLTSSILGQIGNAESGRRMSEMLEISGPVLQVQLVMSIGSIANTEVIGSLLGLLNGETTDETRLLVVITLGQILSRHQSDLDIEMIDQLKNNLAEYIFCSDRGISTAALEAFVKSQDDPARILLGFIHRDVQEEVADEDLFPDTGSTPAGDENRIPIEDTTGESNDIDGEQISQLKKDRQDTSTENLGMQEEKVTVDEFLRELPNDGDPSSSTLASMLTRGQTEEQERESLPGRPDSAQLISPVAEWIPIQATRLLIDNTDLNDQIIDSLLESADGASETLRREFVDIFSHIKTPKVLPFLEQCLKQGNRETRLAALYSLKEVALPVTDQNFIRELMQDDDPLIRQRALELLVANNVESPVQYLKQAFADDDRQVCITAMEKIGKENLNDDVRATLFDLLIRSGGELTQPIAQILRRVEDSEAIRWLLEKTVDQELEDYHWIFINALTETYAPEQAFNQVAKEN